MSTHHRLQMLFCVYELFRGLPSRDFWCILRKERRPFTKTLPPTSSAHSRLLVQGFCAHSHQNNQLERAEPQLLERLRFASTTTTTTCRATRIASFLFSSETKNMVNSVTNGSVPSSVPPSCDQDQDHASPGTRKQPSRIDRISTTFDDTRPKNPLLCCSSNLVNEVPLPPNHG